MTAVRASRRRRWTARRIATSAWDLATRGSALAALAVLATPTAASAERLQEAMRQALRSNPTLAAARADTAAVGEGVVQARVAGRPRASITASETEFAKQPTASTLVPDRTLRSDVVLNVPLYRSGIVKYAVKDAERRYDAARQDLRATTAELLSAVTAAYSDVIRDETIVEASERNVAALQATLRATRGRFSIGDMTITDVSLSEARLSLAEGSLRAARARLIVSREEYIRIIGRPAVDLSEVGNFAGLPDRVETALAEAIDDNGALQAAQLRIDSAGYRIRSLQGERGLRVSAFSAGGYFNNLNSIDSRLFFAPRDTGTAAQVGVAVELPLYQGGLPASRVRQARSEQAGAIEEAIALRRSIVSQTRSAFANWKLALEYLGKAQDAVAANERALKGARMENNIGTRTLLDVLDTERELFNSRVTAASVRRDVNVAAFTLLAVTGKADPEDLGLTDVVRPDRMPPVEPRGSWSDWADGASGYRSESTATSDSPVQDGVVQPR